MAGTTKLNGHIGSDFKNDINTDIIKKKSDMTPKQLLVLKDMENILKKKTFKTIHQAVDILKRHYTPVDVIKYKCVLKNWIQYKISSNVHVRDEEDKKSEDDDDDEDDSSFEEVEYTDSAEINDLKERHASQKNRCHSLVGG